MIEDHSSHIIRKFFQPSVVSGFLAVLTGFIASGLSLYFFIIRQSDFSEYYETLFTVPANTSEQIVLMENAINSSPLAADIAVFMFWMVIGLLVYIAGEVIFKTIRDGRSFYDEMDHTIPEQRATLFAIGLQHILLRLIGIGGLVGLYFICVEVLPMIIVHIYQLSNQNQILPSILLMSLSFIIGSLIVYLLTLCARLVTYRLRVFGFLYQ